MNKILEVRNLRKVFKDGLATPLEVLKDIDLTVEKGEFVSLMGESGSGKSTLLYQIGFLDSPTEGEVIINGNNVHKLNDDEQSKLRREDIGFVFQFYNLIPNLSVEDNILLPVIMAGKKKKEFDKRLDELLEIVGLSDKRNNLPKQLSGGQQQRVAIARAVIMNPSLILADEPTGNLDSVSTVEIMNLFKKLNKEHNITIIQVTHSDSVAKYADRIIRLKDGRIVSGNENNISDVEEILDSEEVYKEEKFEIIDDIEEITENLDDIEVKYEKE